MTLHAPTPHFSGPAGGGPRRADTGLPLALLEAVRSSGQYFTTWLMCLAGCSALFHLRWRPFSGSHSRASHALSRPVQ